MILSMKMCLPLLWGVSVLFATDLMSASILGTSNSTAEPLKPHTEPHKPAGISVATPTETTVPPPAETEEAHVTHRSVNGSYSDLVAMNTVAAAASSADPRLLHTSTAGSTDAALPPHNATMFETEKPSEDQMHQRSATTSTDKTAPATTSATTFAAAPATTPATTSATTFAAAPATTFAAASATVIGSSSQTTSTIKPEVTSTLSSTTSPANSTQAPVFIQTLSSPSASTTTTVTANPTSKAAPVLINVTPTTSTGLLSTPEPVSLTGTLNSTTQFPDTAGSRSTAVPPTVSFSTDSPISTTNASITNVSTSPAAVLIPHGKKLPVPTTKSTPVTTTTPCEASNSPSSTEVQPCSTRGVANLCLITIAFLAALATIFIVITIILCTKLSARKFKVKTPPPATEMMCISALLPERNYNYTRQRNPVTNGVLVIHGGADSDEEGEDNVTLSSFLPENDRFV